TLGLKQSTVLRLQTKCSTPNQSQSLIMVPKFPGSRTSSKATINFEVSTGFDLGISKIANALLGVFKLLIFFNSASVIKCSCLASLLRASIVYNSLSSKREFSNSLMVFMPSATNIWCCCLYFFCCKLVINFIWLFDNIQIMYF